MAWPSSRSKRPTSSRFAVIGGLKRAAQLVRRYGSLDVVLEAAFCRTEAKMLRLYRLIGMMDASVPLPSLVD
jgi:hypothetical protein